VKRERKGEKLKERKKIVLIWGKKSYMKIKLSDCDFIKFIIDGGINMPFNR